MQYNIKSMPVTYPRKVRLGFEVSDLAADLINKLLCKDKDKRLGAEGDVSEVLGHPFFSGLDLEKLLSKELEPPYKPFISDDLFAFDNAASSQLRLKETVIDRATQKLIKKN